MQSPLISVKRVYRSAIDRDLYSCAYALYDDKTAAHRFWGERSSPNGNLG